LKLLPIANLNLLKISLLSNARKKKRQRLADRKNFRFRRVLDWRLNRNSDYWLNKSDERPKSKLSLKLSDWDSSRRKKCESTRQPSKVLFRGLSMTLRKQLGRQRHLKMPLDKDKKKKQRQPLNLNASDWLGSNNYKRLRDNRKSEMLRPTSSNRNC